MSFDYKKEYKYFYILQNKSSIVTVAKINCMAVRGKDNLSDENGECVASRCLLCDIAFTIGLPLDGFWFQNAITRIDYAHKGNFECILFLSFVCLIS